MHAQPLVVALAIATASGAPARYERTANRLGTPAERRGPTRIRKRDR